MEAKFKVGQTVRCINEAGYGGAGWSLGKVFVIGRIDFNSTSAIYFPTSGDGVFEKYLEAVVIKPSIVKPIKQQPIVKHVIVQDSCGNFCQFANNFEEACEIAKNYNKENLTIYEMKEVAKVATERKVTKIKSVVPKKK